MSQKKSKKSAGCNFLPLCCGSNSTKTESFDEFEDKTLESTKTESFEEYEDITPERAKIRLEQYEEARRRNPPNVESLHDVSPQPHERGTYATLPHFPLKSPKRYEEKFKIPKTKQQKITGPEENIDLIFDEQKTESLSSDGETGLTSKQNVQDSNEFVNIKSFNLERETESTRDNDVEETTRSLKKRPPTPRRVATLPKEALDALKFKNIETISPQHIKQEMAALKEVKASRSVSIESTAELSKETNGVKLSKSKLSMKNAKCVDYELNSRAATDVKRQQQEQTVALKEDTDITAACDKSNVQSKLYDQKNDQSKDRMEGKLQKIATVATDIRHGKAQEIKQKLQAVNTRHQDINQSPKESKTRENKMRQDAEKTIEAKIAKPHNIQQRIISKDTKDAKPQYIGKTVNASNDTTPQSIQQSSKESKITKDVKLRNIEEDIEKITKASIGAPKAIDIEQNNTEYHSTNPENIEQFKIDKPHNIDHKTKASNDTKLQDIGQIISRGEDVTHLKPQEELKTKILKSEQHLRKASQGVRSIENNDVIRTEDTQMDDNDTGDCLPFEIGNPLKTSGSFTNEEEFAFMDTFGNSHLASSSSREENVRHTLARPEDIPSKHDEVQENTDSMDEMNGSKVDSSLSLDQLVPPSSPVLGVLEGSRPSKPQLLLENFTFLNKNVDLPETKGGEMVAFRKGSVNADLLGVSGNNSDSSVIANYSGSSSDSELAKLIDVKSSDEFLPTKPVFKPEILSLRESPPVIKNVVPCIASDFRDPHNVLKDAGVRVSKTKLGASSLLLGPINRSASMKTPEKNHIPTQTDVRVRPPSARKLEFTKTSPVLRRYLENGSMVANDHLSNAALPRDVSSKSSCSSGNFVDEHSFTLSTKGRTVPEPDCVKICTDSFQGGKTSTDRIPTNTVSNDSLTISSGSGNKRHLTNVPKTDIYCAATTMSGTLDTQPTLSKAEGRLLHRPTQLKHHLTAGQSNNEMEGQENSFKCSLPKVKGAISKDIMANIATSSPYTSVQEMQSRYSLPMTSSDGKTKGQTAHQPKPPDSPPHRSRDRMVSLQRRKRPPNTKASDSSSDENVDRISARRAFGSNNRYPTPPLPQSVPRHGPLPNRVRDEDERERSSGACTSSLPGPLPPPDLLAPSLFIGRARQGLPTVSNVVQCTNSPSRSYSRREPAQSTGLHGSQNSTSRSDTRSRPAQSTGLRGSQDSISSSDTRRGPAPPAGPLGSQPRLLAKRARTNR